MYNNNESSEKVLVKYLNGKREMWSLSVSSMKKFGVLNCVFKILNIPTHEVEYILVFINSDYSEGKYANMVYHHRIEMYYRNRTRVERHNLQGYEDMTGYGCRTNGEYNRFYIGRSNGWMSMYLEVLRRDSTGGTTLLWYKHIDRIYPLGYRK